MNDYEFAYWLYNMNRFWKPRVHAKLDGFYGRFGKDTEGRFFFQTARSDVLYDPQEIIWYALQKNYQGEHLVRAKHMCAMFLKIQQSDLVAGMSADTAYECEFFFKPLATVEEDKITFITVPYDVSAFENELTIYIHKASRCDGSGEFTRYISEQSFNGIAVKGSMLNVSPIDMLKYQNYVRDWSLDELMALRSLKHKDRARKLCLKAELATVKEHMTRYLLNTEQIQKPQLGQVLEGLVIHINTKQFKVVTHEYRRLRDAVV